MIHILTDQLHWLKKEQTFSQEISSLNLSFSGLSQNVIVTNPRTHVSVTFKYVGMDPEVSGWWFESIDFPKKLKLLLIND